MKKIMIRTLIVSLIATTVWSVRAATDVEIAGTAAEVPAVAAQPLAAPFELLPDPANVTFEKFDCPEGKFSVSVPKGWDPMDSYPYKIDDTVRGIMLLGPENPEGAPITISVLHYAGMGSIEGAEHYIKKVLFNPTRLDAEAETKFSGIEVAGIKGTTFTFRKFHLVMLPFDAPPMEEGVMYEMNPPFRKVDMIVRYIVMPAKPGFYSFSYEAPEDMYEGFSGVFDTVVKSFLLTKPAN
jgi:hypothetical protein